MAQVKIEDVLDHLSFEMKRSLTSALKSVDPDTKIDGAKLFRAFTRAVGRKCGTWENVPDSYVRMD
jgi:hypothetical protein